MSVSVEQEYVIDKALIKGLKPDERNVRNNPALVECFNFKPHSLGLRDVPKIWNPFSGPAIEAAEWPFPQLFKGKSIMLLAFEDAIVEVDLFATPPIGTAYVTYDALSPANTKSITAGGAWHFADFHDVWMLTNDTCMVFKDNYEGMRGGENKVLVYDATYIESICDFRGRAVFAGFGASPWSDQWQAYLEHWMGDSYNVEFALPFGENFVSWSSIGGGDMLWFMYPDRMLEGALEQGYSIDHPLHLDVAKRNERGFMPMPWPGAILRIEPLGKNIMVYGEHGISALAMHSEPVPTFGLVEIFNFGIPNRGAVGGGLNEQVFMDESGVLWRIDANLKVERLGYEQYFAPMIGDAIAISYDEREGDFYLSNGIKSYILSRSGLAQISSAPTSLIRGSGVLLGLYRNVGATRASLLTDTLDFNRRNVKTLHAIEIGVDSTSGIVVAIDSRRDKSQDFERTEWRELREDGKVVFRTTGLEFRIALEAGSWNDAKLDYIRALYRTGCKRDSSALFSA